MENKVYGIIFKNSNKIYNFISDKEYKLDDEVIVDTENGFQFGKVVRTNVAIQENVDYKEIVRLVDDEDKNTFYNNLKSSEEALNKARSLAANLNPDMHIINASFNFDKTQLLINFSADERVDFRELAKKLAGLYHTRIELRQIGARDKAKQISGVGICGFELCCSKFLNQIDTISMNKAKNQGLALNPSKINGSCGRLLCCLNYEDEEYTRCRKDTMPIGTIVNYNKKEAKIVGFDVLTRNYHLMIDNEEIIVGVDEVNGSKK